MSLAQSDLVEQRYAGEPNGCASCLGRVDCESASAYWAPARVRERQDTRVTCRLSRVNPVNRLLLLLALPGDNDAHEQVSSALSSTGSLS